MKQVIQQNRGGEVSVRDVPVPAVRPGWVLVANRYSLISAGTERSRIEAGGRSLLQEARSRPELVKKLVDRVRDDGVRGAAAAVRGQVTAHRAEGVSQLGYSSAGVVVRLGAGVEGIVPGDRVACAGAGWANHAEAVAVPRNLVAKVPSAVDLGSAAYATVGAIALHAVRQADVAVGERVGVIGLGLVGQLAVRILSAAGCEVFGIDPDAAATELAERAGCRVYARSEPALESSILEASSGLGLDAVLICAATRSSDPLELATRIARDRAVLVVVGDVPVSVERGLLYEKELELRVSRSYGPGRYDRDYEERGRDLPPGYVRWTEQRNLQGFVDLIAQGKLDPSPLTTHRFRVDDAAEAYAVLTDPAADPRPFGVLLEYDAGHERLAGETADRRGPAIAARRAARSPVRVGLIGAGGFARSTLLPALAAAGARLVAVTTEGGLSATEVARGSGFERTTSSADELIAADDVDAVVIATRHSTHAPLTAAALRAGKAVFVEKPLALTDDELLLVAEEARDRILMVGFNRRFAPLTERFRAELGDAGDLVLAARVNAGPVPPGHWVHDFEEGGGRLIGEVCHFVDLLAHLAGSRIVRAHALAVPQAGRPLECSDSLVATLQFESGAVGSIVYSGGGDPRLPKERIEGYTGGTALVLDDFRRLEVYRGKRRVFESEQDKGHRAQIARFVHAVAGTAEPPPVDSYLESSRATLALVDSLRSAEPMDLS